MQASERVCRVGAALCAAACPDAPYNVAVGGDNKQNYIELVDLNVSDQCKLFCTYLFHIMYVRVSIEVWGMW